MKSVSELFDWVWRVYCSLCYESSTTLLLEYDAPDCDDHAADVKEEAEEDDGARGVECPEPPADGTPNLEVSYAPAIPLVASDDPAPPRIHASRRSLGEGHFSVVRAGHLMDESQRQVAIKSICNVTSTCEMIALEISILQELQQCSSVVRLLSTFADERHTHLIFERCSHDLFSEIKRSPTERLPERTVRKLAKEMGDAILFCHDLYIAHRDIKPENVLVRSDGSVCLADFGLSKRFDNGCRFYTQVGSAFYVAPEVFLHGDDGYDQACDVWSFGVILYCALTGDLPFYATTDDAVVRNLTQARVLPRHPRLSNPAFEFISLLVETDVSKRIRVHDACAHSFLRGE